MSRVLGRLNSTAWHAVHSQGQALYSCTVLYCKQIKAGWLKNYPSNSNIRILMDGKICKVVFATEKFMEIGHTCDFNMPGYWDLTNLQTLRLEM